MVAKDMTGNFRSRIHKLFAVRISIVANMGTRVVFDSLILTRRNVGGIYERYPQGHPNRFTSCGGDCTPVAQTNQPACAGSGRATPYSDFPQSSDSIRLLLH